MSNDKNFDVKKKKRKKVKKKNVKTTKQYIFLEHKEGE